MTTQDFKLLFAEIEDFKGIRHRVIEFDGKSALLIAGNGQTKSSLIDAILSPLDSTFVPSEPINNQSDEQRGIIRLKIGNDESIYEINAVYTPGNRTGTITLYKDGEQIKGAVKSKIREIFGDVSFDVYSFMKMSMNDKIATVKKLTGKAHELNKLDSNKAELQESRKLLNHDISQMQEVNDKENRPFTAEEIRKYEKEVDINSLNQELAAMQPKIDAWQRVNNGTQESKKTIRRLTEEERPKLQRQIIDVSLEVEELQKKLEAAKAKVLTISDESRELENKIREETTKMAKGLTWLDANKQPDLSDINKRIGEANEHNRMHQIINIYRERQKALIKKQEERDVIQKDIDDIDAAKIELIKNSQLPVQGLAWDEKMLYYNGLPFEQSQLNTATYLSVGIDLAMAMNNKLKLVFIREASLFDKPTFAAVSKKILERGYMYIAEVVDPEGKEMEVKFVEKDING